MRRGDRDETGEGGGSAHLPVVGFHRFAGAVTQEHSFQSTRAGWTRTTLLSFSISRCAASSPSAVASPAWKMRLGFQTSIQVGIAAGRAAAEITAHPLLPAGTIWRERTDPQGRRHAARPFIAVATGVAGRYRYGMPRNAE